MIAPEHDLIDRFHRVLVEEIRKRKPEYLSESFTVAEIYQDLVPYHTHRDRIGVRMNGDYEDALLRLLSGEGGRLELESDAARRDFLAELKNAEPNTGIYRDFAAVAVKLNPSRIPEESDPTAQRLAGKETATEIASVETDGGKQETSTKVDPVEVDPVEVDAPKGGGAKGKARAAEPAGDADPGSSAPRFLPDPVAQPGNGSVSDRAGDRPSDRAPAKSSASTGGSNKVAAGGCAWCGEKLPVRDDLVFCPRCGGDSRVFPCAACGTELETDWSFCVACGEKVGG